MAKVEVYPNPETLNLAALEFITTRAWAAVGADGRFCLVLSGGSTPLPIYRMLGEPPLRENLPWRHIHLFWGDERCVPPEDPRSNYGQAMRALAAPRDLPAENIHRIEGERGAEAAAAEYQERLVEFFGSEGPPALDLLLLGMGKDGHVASLFPDGAKPAPGLGWVAAVPAPERIEPKVERVSLTLPVINAAGCVLFLASGREKAAAARRALGGDESLPASAVRPAGELVWLLDQEAAGVLEE